MACRKFNLMIYSSLWLFILTIGASLTYAQAAPAAISFDSSSKYQIVLPDEYLYPAVDHFLQQTALCLQNSLLAVTGNTCEITTEKQKQPGAAIYLGQTKAAAAAGINVAGCADFGGVIAERSGDIFLLGRDEHRLGSKAKSRTTFHFVLGTVKTAITFMEDYLGTRFVMPGENGIEYAAAKGQPMPKTLTREVIPPVMYAPGRHYSLFYDYSNNCYGAGKFYTYGGHSYYSAVNKDTYAKTNPEYFALIGGKRVTSENHLCISNKEVQELFYKEMLAKLDAGASVVQLAQTDNYKPCQCDECQKLGDTDSPGEKLWMVHLGLADRLLKDRPDKKVHIIAYGPSKAPPLFRRSLPKNVVIELCLYSPDMLDLWQLWSELEVPGGFTVYLYYWGRYPLGGLTPKTSIDFCLEQTKTFREKGVIGIYRCGFGELFGMEGPAYYAFGKSLENPNLTREEAMEEYCQAAFKGAAIPMRKFYEPIYNRIDSMYIGLDFYSYPPRLPRNKVPRDPLFVFAAIYTPELLDSMDKNLRLAESQADSPKVAARLQLIRQEFTYLQHLGKVIAFYNAFRFQPDRHNFDQLTKALEARNAWIDSLFQEDGKLKRLENWPEILPWGNATKELMMTNGSGNIAPLRTPFTWDLEEMHRRDFAGGDLKRQLTINKTETPPQTGFAFDDGAWAKIPWQEMLVLQMMKSKAKAKFKVTYDQKALYFAFEATVDPAQEYEKLGRDGAAWRQDTLEIFLDPQGKRWQYFHFIFNPLPESFYDAAFALATDPADPNFNKADKSWNGAWTYENELKDGVWRALAVVPFATLQRKCPEPGTKWTMNIGREAYHFDANQKNKVELLQWSPNMTTMTFLDQESFGELIFE